jgi:hypothetical protein
MASADLALLVFAVCNGLRIAAYVPQILRLARDEGGAGAVSPTTWGLFALANVSTVLYAALVAADLRLALVFCANTLGSALIFGLTLLKRRRHIRAQRPGRRAPAALSVPARVGGPAHSIRRA